MMAESRECARPAPRLTARSRVLIGYNEHPAARCSAASLAMVRFSPRWRRPRRKASPWGKARTVKDWPRLAACCACTRWNAQHRTE